jgi:hypothetical protein
MREAIWFGAERNKTKEKQVALTSCVNSNVNSDMNGY